MTKIKKYSPQTKSEVLKELKQVDKFNLLEVKAKERAPGPDAILISRFEEINKFIDENKRHPSDHAQSKIECMLFRRLLEIRLDPTKIKPLLPLDKFDLLKGLDVKDEDKVQDNVKVEPAEENKLGLTDKFNLLKSPGNSIFNIVNVKPISEKVTTMPKEIAKRKKCKNFTQFESLFKKCHLEIKNGDRSVDQFRNEQDVKVGDFFIYNGITCYIAEIGDVEIKNNRNNARLKLVFDNGSESNMLQRSLTAELYKNGRRISPPRLQAHENEISEQELTGFIYILSTKSTDPAIKSIPNLFKIGFSTTSVMERIRNAKSDPTYLMADAIIKDSYKVAGIKPVYFENLIHKLFDHVNIPFQITDASGVSRKATEWYSVPLDVIHVALKLIESKEIVDYIYDSESMKLIKKPK